MIFDFPSFTKEKLILPELLSEWAEKIREKSCKIASLNGSFDLLHAGHLQILFEASKQADVLIVALNTDNSIKRYKGENRPIIALENRLQMMSAIGFVDYITYFDQDDPREILKRIKPDVHVNGSEWGENCIESEVVRENGGRMHIVKLKEGLSTSYIIKRINETHCNL